MNQSTISREFSRNTGKRGYRIKQAQMTKQTLYRYFSSKIDLFKATLKQLNSHNEIDLTDHLQRVDDKQALLGFAKEFIHFHLSKQHIATIKLLVAEGNKAPQTSKTFTSITSLQTEAVLSHFFNERFSIKDIEGTIHLWLGMLLPLRTEVLQGQISIKLKTMHLRRRPFYFPLF